MTLVGPENLPVLFYHLKALIDLISYYFWSILAPFYCLTMGNLLAWPNKAVAESPVVSQPLFGMYHLERCCILDYF
jgi:hypothetical protein